MTQLSKTVLKILEKENFHLCGPITKQDKAYWVELEFFSPCGEDVIETIWFDGTDSGFIEAICDRAENFDVDDHVMLWASDRGKNGVPESIEELVKDAKSIKTILQNLAEKLNK